MFWELVRIYRNKICTWKYGPVVQKTSWSSESISPPQARKMPTPITERRNSSRCKHDLVPGWQKQKETLVRLSICEINKTIVSSENDWETRFCYQAGSLTSSTPSLLPNIWKLFKLSFDSFEPFQVIWVNVKQKDIFRKAITCLEWWTGSPVSLKHSPVHSPPSDPFVSMQSTMFENIGQCHPNVDI